MHRLMIHLLLEAVTQENMKFVSVRAEQLFIFYSSCTITLYAIVTILCVWG
jgi:hypothetical protein